MDQGKEPESPSLEIKKVDYLRRFGEVDRRNIERVSELFTAVMAAKERSAVLLAVGGTVTKPLPRKDIDLAIALKQEAENLTRENYDTELDFSIAQFRVSQDIVSTILEYDPSFKITKVREPSADRFLQNPNIMAHGGSIEIVNKNEGGMPIEFTQEYSTDRNAPLEEQIRQRKKSFVVLASTDPSFTQIQ